MLQLAIVAVYYGCLEQIVEGTRASLQLHRCRFLNVRHFHGFKFVLFYTVLPIIRRILVKFISSFLKVYLSF